MNYKFCKKKAEKDENFIFSKGRREILSFEDSSGQYELSRTSINAPELALSCTATTRLT